MSKKYVLPILVMFALTNLAIFVFTASASEDINDLREMPGAVSYASDYGVSLEEAVKRLQMQDEIGALQEQLFLNEEASFAGLYVEHVPKYEVVVLFTTEDGEKRIQSYLASDDPLIQNTTVRKVSATWQQLKDIQASLHTTIAPLGVPIESGINVRENIVELYVLDTTELDTALELANIELSQFLPFIRIIEIENVSSLEANIYGGHSLSTCTAGFSVVDYYGNNGIMTAGHCSNQQSFGSTSLTYMGGIDNGPYDVQWHTASSLTFQNKVKISSYSTKEVNYVAGVLSQHVGNYICKYGKATYFTCGNIIDISFNPYESPDAGSNNDSSTFIRVRNSSGVDLSNDGDSGAPWYSAPTSSYAVTAYGIHTGAAWNGNQLTDAFYMPVTYGENVLNVLVKRSP